MKSQYSIAILLSLFLCIIFMFGYITCFIFHTEVKPIEKHYDYNSYLLKNCLLKVKQYEAN